jgi:hypothetical protein
MLLFAVASFIAASPRSTSALPSASFIAASLPIAASPYTSNERANLFRSVTSIPRTRAIPRPRLR